MPISRETRPHQRRPWRVDGVPRPRRCSAEQLRRLRGSVYAASRLRVPTIDGKRRFAAITDKRRAVILHVISEAGFSGRDRLYISQIAGACDTSEDTVLKALADAEVYGWIRRTPIYRAAEDGTKRRDASIFELLAPEPQGAAGSCTTESILPFYGRRRALAERRRDTSELVLWVYDPEKAAAVAAKCGW